MTISKAEMIDLVRDLPDAIDVEELIYRLYMREKLAASEADFDAGRTFTAAEVREQSRTW